MSHSNTPPVKNLAPLTTRSSSLRCVSAAEHHTAEQYSTPKLVGQNARSISQKLIYHGTLIRTSWKAKNVQAIEAIQQMFTYKITEVKHLNYCERLQELKLNTIQRRRERYIIIYV